MNSSVVTVGGGTATVVTTQMFVKKGEVTIVGLSDGHYNYGWVVADLTNGSVISVGGAGYISNSITLLANDWYLISLTFTTHSTGTYKATCSLLDGSYVSGNPKAYTSIGVIGFGVYIYGFQTEEASYATSYIPTSGQSGGVTRVADVCNNGANDQVINSTEGVLYAEISTNSDGTDKAISLNNNTVGSLSNRLWLGYSTSEKRVYALGYVNNSIQFVLSKLMTDETAFVKIACKYALNDVAFFVNGEKVDTDTSALAFTELNSFDFNIGNGSGAAPFYGNVKDVRVYNTALTDNELQKLTTI